MQASRSLFFLLFAVPLTAFAAGSEVVGENLLWLALILMAARLFAPLAGRFGFPAVLGELLLGVLLGNLGLFGLHYPSSLSGLNRRTQPESRPRRHLHNI